MSISILEAILNIEPAIILSTRLDGKHNTKLMYVRKQYNTGNYIVVGTICIGTETNCNNVLYDMVKSYNYIIPMITGALIKHNLPASFRSRFIKYSDIDMKINEKIIPSYIMNNFEQYNISLLK
jgi:hypothetical protein